MKKYLVLPVLLGFFILIGTTSSSAQPNLVVRNVSVNFATRTVRFRVRNIGSSLAGRQRTYVEINRVGADPMTTPQSQRVLLIPPIPSGGFVFRILSFNSFNATAKPVLGNVNNLTALNLVITADAKNTVNESNENDNASNTNHP